MIKINKVTTKTGDYGFTLGPENKKIKKSDIEIEFFGNLDELNITIGEAMIYNNNIEELLTKLQKELFEIGANFYKNQDLSNDMIECIEENIEIYNKNAKELTSFLLPKGTLNILTLHKARAYTRKCERTFFKTNKQLPNMGIFLNRLSDLFFVLLRKESKETWK